MTISELLQYCMAKPGAEQSVHNDWKATQIKVEDVLFAMVKEVENRPAVSLKTSPELAELLRQQHSDVRPSRHLNKAHWSTVYLDGSLPDSQIYYLVDASYQQAVNSVFSQAKRKRKSHGGADSAAQAADVILQRHSFQIRNAE